MARRPNLCGKDLNLYDNVHQDAECVVEQGAFTPFGPFDPVRFKGCSVRWINDPTNDNSPHGIAPIGSSSDPGAVTDLYGPIGEAHNTLDSNGNFTLSCNDVGRRVGVPCTNR